MNTLSKTKRRILNDLKDRETRQIFYSEHISAAIPIQIRELRKKRKYTQKELGGLAEMDQSTVSDLENPNYEYAPQIGTLERLANAFDVPLIVRFGSWDELWDWENNLTSERLAPKTFDEVLPSLEASVMRSEATAPDDWEVISSQLIRLPVPQRTLVPYVEFQARKQADSPDNQPRENDPLIRAATGR